MKTYSQITIGCLVGTLMFYSNAYAGSCSARTDQALTHDILANRVVIGVAISGAERVRGKIDFKIDFTINGEGDVTYAKVKETNAPDKDAVSRIESEFKNITFNRSDCESQDVRDFSVSVYL